MTDTITVTEAAEMYGVTRQAILQRIETGSLPAEKVGNQWEISLSNPDDEIEYAEPSLEEKLDELLEILRPLRGLIEAMPEAMKQIGPLIEGLKTSPVLRMIGVKL
jgi:excisionase family DNA binding protein